MNTKFSYMYRDGANYKTFYECVFPGEINKEQIDKILCSCDGDLFIPRALGLPGGMFEGESGYDSRYDHYWCEHDFEDSFSVTNDAPTHFITVEDLVESFTRCKDRWEAALADKIKTLDTNVERTASLEAQIQSAAKYSLIQVDREYDGMVDGVWVQNHVGTIDSAAEVARATERANSNRITVAVVEDLGYSEPNYSFRTALKRLDIVQDLNISSNSLASKIELASNRSSGVCSAEQQPVKASSRER